MNDYTDVRFHTTLTFITLKIGRKLFNYTITAILYLKAESNYCRFFFENGKSEVHYGTLGHFERQLAKANCFVRVERSYVANMLHLSEACTNDGITLNCDIFLPVDKNGLKALDAYHQGSPSHSQKPGSHNIPKVAV